MSGDIDRIKDRIRKLMAYANDGAATDGEIENAMRHAAKLIDAHHIDAADIADDGENRRDDMTMGQSFGTSNNARFSTWEASLAWAVANLFGCVKWYISGDTAPVRENGIAKLDANGEAKRGRRICFYGPVVEAAEAAELFSEWAQSIAAMGVIRWGGAFRGDGAMYCMGFATALYNKALAINGDRRSIAAKAPAGLLPAGSATPTTAITLFGRYELIQKRATSWLKNEKGINLGKGGGGGGYRSGSSEAYGEGQSHGRQSQFGRNARRRMLPK